MLELLVANPAFALSSIVLAILFAVVMFLGIVVSEQQRSRLPAATRWSDVREQLALADSELERKRKEIDEANKKIEARDRLVAEVAVLEERREALNLERSGLDDARRQIEETKQAAANVATELATLQSELSADRKIWRRSEGT